jgi:nucleoside-diphosphate-sugar epimerase
LLSIFFVHSVPNPAFALAPGQLISVLSKAEMRVAITGATGFVGQALAKRLLDSGSQVRALARPSLRAESLARAGAEIIPGDLSDAGALDRTFKDAEIVFHCAALANSHGTRRQFFDANVRGTDAVLQAALRARPRRIIYLSSIAVYGPLERDEIIDEDTPLDDLPQERDYYAHSKIEADRLALKFTRNSPVPLTIFRPGIVFGPGRALPIALLGARIGNLDIVFGRQSLLFPLNYIDNLIDALTLAAAEPENDSRQYIILDDEKLTLGRYHDAKMKIANSRAAFFSAQPAVIAATVTHPVARLLPVNAGAFSRRQILRASQDRHYSTRRIRQELNWQPRIPLEEAIARTIQNAP